MTSKTNGTQERIISAVGEELARIQDRFEQADRRLMRAGTYFDDADKEQAEVDRREAAGDHHAAAMQLADLCLRLIRYAVEYRPEALALHLTPIVRKIVEPELRALAEAVARQEVTG